MPRALESENAKFKRLLAVTNAHYNYAPGSAEQRYSRSCAYRIEAGGGTWVYTGDTGPSENLVELARGADVMVSEVIDMAAIGDTLRDSGTVPDAMLPALLAHMEHDHLTPRLMWCPTEPSNGRACQRSAVQDEVRDQPVELCGVLDHRPVAAAVHQYQPRIGMCAQSTSECS